MTASSKARNEGRHLHLPDPKMEMSPVTQESQEGAGGWDEIQAWSTPSQVGGASVVPAWEAMGTQLFLRHWLEKGGPGCLTLSGPEGCVCSSGAEI